MRKNRGRFLGYIISWIAPTPSMSLIYSTIVLYDNIPAFLYAYFKHCMPLLHACTHARTHAHTHVLLTTTRPAIHECSVHKSFNTPHHLFVIVVSSGSVLLSEKSVVSSGSVLLSEKTLHTLYCVVPCKSSYARTSSHDTVFVWGNMSDWNTFST